MSFQQNPISIPLMCTSFTHSPETIVTIVGWVFTGKKKFLYKSFFFNDKKLLKRVYGTKVFLNKRLSLTTRLITSVFVKENSSLQQELIETQ